MLVGALSQWWAGGTGGNTNPAPVLESAKNQEFTTSGAVHNFDPSQITIGAHRVFTIAGTSDSPTLSTWAGSTDDTSSELFTRLGSVDLYGYEWTVVSTLDTNWVLTMSGSVRAGILGLVVSGISTIPTPAEGSGTGPDLPSHASFALPDGPRNALVIDAVAIEGAHVDEAPTASSGSTLIDVVVATGTDDPTDTSRVTLAAAQRTYSQVTEIPAATWGGLADVAAGVNPWTVARLVFLS